MIKLSQKMIFDAYSIIPYDYFRIVRLDIVALYKCKYWYLDNGEDITIELPYGAILKCDTAKLEKKDIKNWENIVIKELENDQEEEKTIFAYYIDGDDNKQGAFTTIYDNGLYNKYVLTDNIKYASVDIYTNVKNVPIVEYKQIENTIYENEWYIYCATRIKPQDRRNIELFTNSFINKYKENGIMPDHNINDLYDKTKEYISEDKRVYNKSICEMYSRKLNKDIYVVFKLKWNDNKVDDIEYYIVPEDKMNLSYEEMYQLAFND